MFVRGRNLVERKDTEVNLNRIRIKCLVHENTNSKLNTVPPPPPPPIKILIVRNVLQVY